MLIVIAYSLREVAILQALVSAGSGDRKIFVSVYRGTRRNFHMGWGTIEHTPT
jgi:hypothetical protein